MRFTELKPEWVQRDANRTGTAIWSLCPCGCGGGLLIPLSNPIDGGATDPPEAWGAGLTARWTRAGEDFATMSLTPSVLIWEDKAAGRQHWHGWITNGEVTC